MVDVTGMSALDTLELLEHVDGLNCVTCDVDSGKASSVNTGTTEATPTGIEVGPSVSSYSGGCSAGDTTSSAFCSTGIVPEEKAQKHGSFYNFFSLWHCQTILYNAEIIWLTN
jgi:hypothetical protein